jgi:hypothetical protein
VHVVKNRTKIVENSNKELFFLLLLVRVLSTILYGFEDDDFFS